ncbi:hypothetical protein QIT38_gp42 [Methanocaldococcus fervens tailed virus 1]|uniref:Uncharacterized protein n=2 Tax=root TaxID=1 RepID=C7P5K3_METFA|nr:hypothetical protein [Methanocaldococcus fervens]YP_010772337.1 hypothetical protein QIT38_gp42 [Methanocaldococcus fervens tailed virus 1]ACV25381.1 hypothetical protein Mefer_1578 [Methanocaldococcus fervens AG86]QNO11510.1 hypothetical protein [Methanocaldococcus fervens tailed virus 1]
MDSKKRGRKTERIEGKCYICKGVPVGGSCRPYPYLPKDCVGKTLIIIPIDSENEE